MSSKSFQGTEVHTQSGRGSVAPALTWLHRRAELRVGSCGLTRKRGVCQRWAPHLLQTISLLEISAGLLHVTGEQEDG